MTILAAMKNKGTWLLLTLGIGLLLLAGCSAGTGSDEQVRLEITPVATPTFTPLTPPTPAPTTYTVKPGDTLSGIAALFGVTVDDIVRVNNITDANVLSDGQILKIPGREAGGTPTQAAPGTGTPQAGQTGTPAPAGSPVLPPPNVTPPQGPTQVPSSPGSSSAPGSTISPTAEP